MNVALDDLSTLVAPGRVVICEGTPGSAKNAQHDASCYNVIFEQEFPDTLFLSGGNSFGVQSDRLAFVAAISSIVSGCTILRVIDRDDHGPKDVADFARNGITVLGRRNLEGYLYDDEILTALCAKAKKPDEAAGLLQDKQTALADSVSRKNSSDDLKSAAGTIFVKARQRLGLTGMGNDPLAFARQTLAPLVTPETKVYAELRSAIFDRDHKSTGSN